MEHYSALMTVAFLAVGCARYPQVSSDSFQRFVESAQERSHGPDYTGRHIDFGESSQNMPQNVLEPATGAVTLQIVSEIPGLSLRAPEPELLTRIYELRFYYDEGGWRFLDGHVAARRSALLVTDEGMPSASEEQSQFFSTLDGRPDLKELFFGNRWARAR